MASRNTREEEPTENDALLSTSARRIANYSVDDDVVEAGCVDASIAIYCPEKENESLVSRHQMIPRQRRWLRSFPWLLLVCSLFVATILMMGCCSISRWGSVGHDETRTAKSSHLSRFESKFQAFLLPISASDHVSNNETSLTAGESIPLSSQPTSAIPTETNLSDATNSLYTKLGVVKTKPGQGSFFYYWFGHNVYPSIRKERAKCAQEGILTFALHPQQGQPDTFWLYQSFTSESYFLNTFTPKIYTANGQGRIRKMLQFLTDNAPLLDLELQSPPICSKGMRYDWNVSINAENAGNNNKNKHQKRKLSLGLLPPGSIYPPNLQPKANNASETSPFDTNTTENNSMDERKGDRTKRDKKKGQSSIKRPYTVIMHMSTHPGMGTQFGQWFCEQVVGGLMMNDDNTLWNFAMHASSDNPDEFWIYETFENEKVFLEHAERLFLATFPTWWNQDATENDATGSISTNSPNLQQELQQFLRKPVEYVALEPTAMQFGMRMRPPRTEKQQSHRKNDSHNHSNHKKKRKKLFSPLHIIRHPP